MFREKVHHQLTEETKTHIHNLFLFKIIVFMEIIGFSFLLSILIIPFLHSKPNFFLVFLPVSVFIGFIYLCLEKPSKEK